MIFLTFIFFLFGCSRSEQPKETFLAPYAEQDENNEEQSNYLFQPPKTELKIRHNMYLVDAVEVRKTTKDTYQVVFSCYSTKMNGGVWYLVANKNEYEKSISILPQNEVGYCHTEILTYSEAKDICNFWNQSKNNTQCTFPQPQHP